MLNLIGGQAQLTFDVDVAAKPRVESGKVKALAATTKKCTLSMPKVPMLVENGFPDYEMVPGLALVAPRDLSH